MEQTIGQVAQALMLHGDIQQAGPALMTISSRARRSLLASQLAAMAGAAKMREVLDDPPAMRALMDRTRAQCGEALTQAQLAAHLAKLALHYWRPDFTPRHVTLMLADFFADLHGATESHLIEACARYRRNVKNTFFPTPGKLRALCEDDIAMRLKTLTALEAVERVLAAQEVPDEERAAFVALTPKRLAQIDAIFAPDRHGRP